MNQYQLQSFSFMVLLVGISVVLFWIFEPFLQVIMLAVVFAVLFHVPYEKLLHLLGKQKSFAAAMIVALILVFFIVPCFVLGSQIVQETQSLYKGMQGNEVHYLQVVQSAIENPVKQIFPDFVLKKNIPTRCLAKCIKPSMQSSKARFW